MYNKTLFIAPSGSDINRIPRKCKPKALPSKPRYFARQFLKYLTPTSYLNLSETQGMDCRLGADIQRYIQAPCRYNRNQSCTSPRHRGAPRFLCLSQSIIQATFSIDSTRLEEQCVQVPLQPLELNHGAFKQPRIHRAMYQCSPCSRTEENGTSINKEKERNLFFEGH